MGVYEANVEDVFSARHTVRLSNGRMEAPHAHAWRVTATFQGDRLDPAGCLVDFVRVQQSLKRICGQLDGAFLNELAPFADDHASAECVARHIADLLATDVKGDFRLYRVSVTESPGCSAAYYP